MRVCVVALIRQIESNGSVQLGERALQEERRRADEWRAGRENRGDDERGG